jgi:hypothetical protein
MQTHQRHIIRFPLADTRLLQQDEAYFSLWEGGADVRLRFHDYGEIYKRPGLYEQIFYERLKCNSPRKALNVLGKVLDENRADIHELRLLDVGAGNGMVGELLDTSRTVGIDIEPEAKLACERDRPGAYDAYYIADLCKLDPKSAEDLRDWQFDAMTCIAALGFGDIPTRAFASAFNLVQVDGWICFNVKETFLHADDQTGFSLLIKRLLVTDILEVHHLERYRHRISINGSPLFYYMLVGKKQSDIQEEMLLLVG